MEEVHRIWNAIGEKYVRGDSADQIVEIAFCTISATLVEVPLLVNVLLNDLGEISDAVEDMQLFQCHLLLVALASDVELEKKDYHDFLVHVGFKMMLRNDMSCLHAQMVEVVTMAVQKYPELLPMTVKWCMMQLTTRVDTATEKDCSIVATFCVLTSKVVPVPTYEAWCCSFFSKPSTCKGVKRIVQNSLLQTIVQGWKTQDIQPNEFADGIIINQQLEHVDVLCSLSLYVPCIRYRMDFQHYLCACLNSDGISDRKYGLELLQMCIAKESKQCDMRPWIDFMHAFEIIDVQKEQHLIEQVWEKVQVLIANAFVLTDTVELNAWPKVPSFAWLKGLLKRTLSNESQSVRKKILVSFLSTSTEKLNNTEQAHEMSSENIDFVYDVLFPVFTHSYMYKMQHEINASMKSIVHDMSLLATDFLVAFLRRLSSSSYEHVLDNHIFKMYDVLYGSSAINAAIRSTPRALKMMMRVFENSQDYSARISSKSIDLISIMLRSHAIPSYPAVYRDEIVKNSIMLVFTCAEKSLDILPAIGSFLQLLPTDVFKNLKGFFVNAREFFLELEMNTLLNVEMQKLLHGESSNFTVFQLACFALLCGEANAQNNVWHIFQFGSIVSANNSNERTVRAIAIMSEIYQMYESNFPDDRNACWSLDEANLKNGIIRNSLKVFSLSIESIKEKKSIVNASEILNNIYLGMLLSKNEHGMQVHQEFISIILKEISLFSDLRVAPNLLFWMDSVCIIVQASTVKLCNDQLIILLRVSMRAMMIKSKCSEFTTKILCDFTRSQWNVNSTLIGLIPESPSSAFTNVVQESFERSIDALYTSGRNPEGLQLMLRALRRTIPLHLHYLRHLSSQAQFELIEGAFSSIWAAYMDANKASNLTKEVIRCFFQVPIFELQEKFIIELPDAPLLLLDRFHYIWTYAVDCRPHVIYQLVSCVCGIWTLYPQYAISFLPEIANILLYKEPVEAIVAGEMSRKSPRHDKIARLIMLSFLERLDPQKYVKAKILVRLVIRHLINLIDDTVTWKTPAMVNSVVFGQKIRCWQALCVLSKYIVPSEDGEDEDDFLPRVHEFLWTTITSQYLPQVRYYIEVFAIQITLKCPLTTCKTYIMPLLRDYEQSRQVSTSVLLIFGYVIRHELEIMKSAYEFSLIHLVEDQSIIKVILPYLNSSKGHMRVIAQSVVATLEPVLTHCPNGMDFAFGIIKYLKQNKDSVRMLERQALQFTSINLVAECSVLGLTQSAKFSDLEEIFPVSVSDEIKRVLELVMREIYAEENEKKVDAEVPNTTNAIIDASASFTQRKIKPEIPVLDSLIEEYQLSKTMSAANRVRHKVIMCASLIDKLPNLAGLARTCEIFNAEKLVMPSISISKQELFQQISVTANKWMPMEEVREPELPNFLRSCRKQGYTIVGVEQTNDSKCLSSFAFPDQVVIVLGKEREGIPIDILRLLDYCIEIPQLGLIRSLNVHVSGALILWEYTKQRLTRS